jgi:nitrite reductase (NADH) small subunit
MQGRPDGIRAKIRRAMGSDSAPPPAAPSAPAPGRPSAAAAVRPDKTWVKAPEGYEAVVALADVPDGTMAEAIVSGRAIAIARVGEAVYALANECPHAGGPLGDGTLDGTSVTCPFHGWSFDVTNGACHTHSNKSVDSFDTTVVEGTICVRIS